MADIELVERICKAIGPGCNKTEAIAQTVGRSEDDVRQAMVESLQFTMNADATWSLDERRASQVDFSPIPLPELLKMDFPEPDYIVDGYVPEAGISILAGSAGVGKTVVGLHISVAVAAGLPVFGRFPTKKARVIYLDEETGLQELVSRLRRIVSGLGIEPESLGNLLVLSNKGVQLSESGWIEAAVRCAGGGPALLVVDTVRRVMGACEENAADALDAFYADALKPLLRGGITLLLIHHYKKPQKGAEDGLHMLRGSSEFGNIPDSVLSLQKAAGDENQLTLHHLKSRRDAARPDLVLTLEWGDSCLKIEAAGSVTEILNKVGLCMRDVKAWCETGALRGFTTKQVESAMHGKGYNHKCIGRALNGLLSDYLVKPEQGTYVVRTYQEKPDARVGTLGHSIECVPTVPNLPLSGTKGQAPSVPIVPIVPIVPTHSMKDRILAGLPAGETHKIPDLQRAICHSRTSDGELDTHAFDQALDALEKAGTVFRPTPQEVQRA